MTDEKDAARRIRDVADGFFVMSLNSRYAQLELGQIAPKLRDASKHGCLHVLRSEEDVPWAIILVAAVSDEATAQVNFSTPTPLIDFQGWITGRNPIVVDVIATKPAFDGELQRAAEKLLVRFGKEALGKTL